MSAAVESTANRNCLPCRVVSGAGLLGISGYLAYHARNNPTPTGRLTIFTIAASFAGLGIARWSQLYPFNHNNEES